MKYPRISQDMDIDAACMDIDAAWRKIGQLAAPALRK